MPKRTNFFQKLITQIYKQLSGSAIVTESKMLVDKDTGSLVEVDIVIESHVGLVPIIIGIECTSKSRPADLVWYRQLVKNMKTCLYRRQYWFQNPASRKMFTKS